MTRYDKERKRWLSDNDLNREQRERHHNEKMNAQTLREERKYHESIKRIREAHDLRQQEKIALNQIDKETAIKLKILDQGLLPERLDLEFNDLIRRSDIELQTLQAELKLQDEITQRQHHRDLDQVYQTTLMEITQETARLLDEQNKAIAINQQETKSQLMREAQQHQQTLEREQQEHQQGMQRDTLQNELAKDKFTHEEITCLAVRLMARNLGISEEEVSQDQVTEWVHDFQNGS
jgi:hypothetical protein